MSTSRHHDTIVSFRNEWVLGRLEYQRAVEALEAAEHAAALPIDALELESAAPSERERVAADVERARARLVEIRARLADQFDAFCGVGTLRAVRSG